MNSVQIQNEDRQQPPQDEVPAKSRYRLFYYALAGFNLLTIAISIWSGYRTLEIYDGSLRQSRVWSERRGQFMELANLAAAANAPGNDIFRTNDLNGETGRLAEARDHYLAAMQAIRNEISQNLEEEFREKLAVRFDLVNECALRMQRSAENTLHLYSLGQMEEATREMAAMDAHLADTLLEIGRANSEAHSIRTRLLEREEKRLGSLTWMGYLFFAAISLAVVGVTLCGRQLLVKMERAEKNLASSEIQLRGILDNAVDAIITIDEMGTVESFNPAAEKLFGYSSEEILGENISCLMPAPYRDEHDGYLANYRKTGERKIIGIGREATGLRKDGSSFPLDLAISESTILGKRTYTGIVRDITERKHAEQTLVQAQTELQAVFDSSPVGMCLGDTQGHCSLVNSKFEQISGFHAEDMFGERWVGSLHPEDRDRVVKEWYNAIALDQPFESESRLMRADGSVVWTNVKVATIRSEESTIGYVATMEDITLRRQAETDLWNNNIELSLAQNRLLEQKATLEHQARTLLEAQERAEQASRAKSEFLANMSHEIRTPMTAILGYTDMLYEEGNIQQAPESRVNAIRTIQRNGEHLLGIINDILDLSKIEAGKLTVEAIECSPVGLIDDVLSLMMVRSQAKGIELTAQYETPLPVGIVSDPTRIRQILMNLVGNAIKFTEVGGVRILVRLINQDSPRIELDVVDTGIGMSEEQMNRLFQPFSQADSSMTRQFGGTGLGLTISKRLANMLGGDAFIVETKQGVGTRFRLTIAAVPVEGARLVKPGQDVELTPQRTEASEVNRPEQRISGCRVLVAEDSPDNQRLITYVLKKAGAELTVVENGQLAVEQAIEAWRGNWPFDVILMDMQMPVLDGYGATDRLRIEGYKGPIIALTAHTMASDRQKCIDAGCNDHAPKPINREKLVQLIASYYSTPEGASKQESSRDAVSGALG